MSNWSGDDGAAIGVEGAAELSERHIRPNRMSASLGMASGFRRGLRGTRAASFTVARRRTGPCPPPHLHSSSSSSSLHIQPIHDAWR